MIPRLQGRVATCKSQTKVDGLDSFASLPAADDKVALVSSQDAVGDRAVGTCIRVNG